MKFCSKCGKEIMDDAIICIHCGCSTASNNASPIVDPTDAPNTGFAVLGFFVPIVGLILYLTNKDKSPKKAHSAGKGALIGFCVSLGISILYGAIAGAMFGSMIY